MYRVGQYRPRTLATVNENQLTIAPGHVVVNDLQQLKEKKFPDLSWKVDDKKGTTELLDDVIAGKLDYTIADSVAISLYQRVHPELAVALDVSDEQPVTWFSRLDDDNTLSAALLDFFNTMNEDGSLARLEEKYLGHGDDFDYVDTRSFLRAVDSVLPDLKPLFEKYAQEIDWRLLAAISYQESHWDAQATSPTGVRGLMMLTKKYRSESWADRPYRCRTKHQRRRAIFAGHDEQSTRYRPRRRTHLVCACSLQYGLCAHAGRTGADGENQRQSEQLVRRKNSDYRCLAKSRITIS